MAQNPKSWNPFANWMPSREKSVAKQIKKQEAKIKALMLELARTKSYLEQEIHEQNAKCIGLQAEHDALVTGDWVDERQHIHAVGKLAA